MKSTDARHHVKRRRGMVVSFQTVRPGTGVIIVRLTPSSQFSEESGLPVDSTEMCDLWPSSGESRASVFLAEHSIHEPGARRVHHARAGPPVDSRHLQLLRPPMRAVSLHHTMLHLSRRTVADACSRRTPS